ncbi:hypothetical protein skT53_27500 [Effusibacillus dendaii]|uniref:Uncharacterized protein n=1 Tax=Effusibacillus dendaii TaxID=2743772 RepID=A0A7I8DCF2_9BACL|nr:hypothetical protein skT53_27500 [Effusibacillus dendaii]
MVIEFIDGLLFTSITLMHQGKFKTLENVVIDTEPQNRSFPQML